MKIFFYVFALSLFFYSGVSFAADNISVRAEINKGAITIGEKVQYTVLVRHSPKIRLLGSIEFPNPGEFHVGASKEIAPLKDKDIVSAGRRFEISAFGLGEFVIEEIPIQYLDEKGVQHEIRTNRLYITVESVDKSGKVKTDIKGIKGPAELKTKLLPWILGGSGLTLFLILAFTIW